MNKLNKAYLNTITLIFLMLASFSMLLINVKTNVSHRYIVEVNNLHEPLICDVDEELTGQQVVLADEKVFKMELEYEHTNCVSLAQIKSVDFNQVQYVEILEQDNNLMAYILGNLI